MILIYVVPRLLSFDLCRIRAAKLVGVSAIILAGGRGTRMGGMDKGLIQLQNKLLIEHVISRLQPQVDEILINANREIVHYKTLGLGVLQDEITNFAGPLAGFSLGLKYAKYDYVLAVPCDSPLLPIDLAQRLMTGMKKNNADIAVASSNGDAHPVFCLCKKNVLPSLQAFLDKGERKVSLWQKSQNYSEVDFSDCSNAFTNLNTPEDFDALALKLGHA
ncbi:MAG: molybdenum cofactor guanylyltransferase MobA [Methylophilaceae bacterium]